ncbi:hypothetical protein Ahy_A07g031667 [Arachis hypogaea]|uniref:Large ribosomal subunit protein bL20c n=1 Tax=Arachis hypogaea TaxID=3818 RepID=A0A445C4U4_ARAHY|nr:hypothetical protein Ahy_A07g031667 [Arachis hypogaea]
MIANHVVNYGNFMHGLTKENIQLNRKVLSELSMHEPYSFKIKHELLPLSLARVTFLSVAATSASSAVAVAAAAAAAACIAQSLCHPLRPTRSLRCRSRRRALFADALIASAPTGTSSI